MKRYLSLFKQFATYATKAELEFRLSTMSYFVFSFIWVFTTYIVVNVVYSRAGKVAGWTREEALLLVLVYYVTSSIIKNFVTPSVIELVEKIRKGELDFILTKPVDTQFLLAMQKLRIVTSSRALVMFTLLIIYMSRINLHPDLLQIGTAVVVAIAGIIGMYAFYFFIATLSIWLENMWNIDEVFIEALEMSKHPYQIYPPALRTALIYVFPVVAISSLPTVALLNRLDPLLAITFVISSFVLLFLSRKFFYFAVKRYASASS